MPYTTSYLNGIFMLLKSDAEVAYRVGNFFFIKH